MDNHIPFIAEKEVTEDGQWTYDNTYPVGIFTRNHYVLET